jgi:hypothetical protein
MSKEAMILKSDAGGRVVVPLARQVELVREFERSGLSGPRFAAMAGVKYQTFATWRRKHGSLPAQRKRPVAPQTGGAWMEAVLAPAQDTLVVRLPGGASVEVTHRSQAVLAAQLIHALRSESC